VSATASSYLDHLQSAARVADQAEQVLREEVSRRLKVIEEDRKFAYRRLNFMKAIAEGVAGADSEEIAVANALAVLRAKFGWSSDSEARQAVLSHFAPVAQAAFMSLALKEAEAPDAGVQEIDVQGIDVLGTLKDFESWYVQTHGSPFWILFEHYIPETPVVDF
jgi:hypothetical protein